MQLEFTTLDVFTTTRYCGNPLAVIRVPARFRNELTEDQKQKVAREFNYSEVTFLHEPAQGEGVVDFDIFTPKSRMTFAGHPTIGTTIYVAQNVDSYAGVKALRTLAGTIPFEYEAQAGRAAVAIPHNVHIHQKRLPHPLAKSEGDDTNVSSVPIISIVKGMAFGLARLPDLEALGAMNGPLLPPGDRFKGDLLDAEDNWNSGYTGTFYYVDLGTRNEGGIERRVLRTRSIPDHEDPGTGSASAALCCYLAITEAATGAVNFHLTQGVEMGRQCDIFVTVQMEDDGKAVKEVELSGTAVEVMMGVLNVPI